MEKSVIVVKVVPLCPMYDLVYVQGYDLPCPAMKGTITKGATVEYEETGVYAWRGVRVRGKVMLDSY